MQVSNNYLSDYSLRHTNGYSLFIHPYAEAAANFKAVSVKKFSEACKHLLAGLALIIPIINALAVWLFRTFATSYQLPPLAIQHPVVQLTPVNQQLRITPRVILQNIEQDQKTAEAGRINHPVNPLPQRALVPIAQEPALPLPTAQTTIQIPAPSSPAQALQPPPAPIEDPRQVLMKYVDEAHSKDFAAQPLIIAGLTECNCIPGTVRAREIESKILTELEYVSRDQTIRYVSVGSGELLQDWLNIAKLVKKGFHKFSIHLVDTKYKEPDFKKYSLNILKKQFHDGLSLLGATELAIHSHESIDKYLEACPSDPIHILSSVDVPSGFEHVVAPLEINRLSAVEELPNAFYLNLVGNGDKSKLTKAEDLAHKVTGYSIAELRNLYYQTGQKCNQHNYTLVHQHTMGTSPTAKPVRQIPWLVFLRILYNRKTDILTDNKSDQEKSSIRKQRPLVVLTEGLDNGLLGNVIRVKKIITQEVL